MSDFTKILNARTSDGSGDAYQIKQVVRDLTGATTREHLTVYATGTFDGATVQLDHSPSADGPWVSESDVAFDSAGSKSTPMSRHAWVRGTVSSAGASTSVTLWIG